jgi:uncharacterized membrane protein
MFCPHSAAGPVKGMMQPTLSVFCSSGACGAGAQAKSSNSEKHTGSIVIIAECFFIIMYGLLYDYYHLPSQIVVFKLA